MKPAASTPRNAHLFHTSTIDKISRAPGEKHFREPNVGVRRDRASRVHFCFIKPHYPVKNVGDKSARVSATFPEVRMPHFPRIRGIPVD